MFAFPRELRLLTPESFSFVFQKPYRAYSPYITILARKNTLEYPRIGFAISKKNIKLASDRNRIKRIVRDSFRLHRNQLPCMDFVITAKKAVVELDNNAVRIALDKLWQRYS